MKRELMCGLMIIASCSRSESPRTTGFAMDQNALSKIATICHSAAHVGDARNNGNPLESKRFVRDWCELALDRDHKKVWGDTMIEFEGHSYEGGAFCGLHIGPVNANNPVPPTILENFIDDPALARQIDAKLAPIDITKEYSYQERVAGFQLDVVQQSVRVSGGYALVVDLRMNGCDQYPDASPAVTKTGRPIEVTPQ
jgi:hypothetical protein